MNTRNKFLAVMGLLFVVPWLSGCGAAGDPASAASSGAGSGGSGVAVTGTVEAPVSTSTSISVGASASKSVGKGSDDSNADQTIIVSKASTDIPVTGGTVTATLPGGTKLDDGQISSSGAITGIVIDPASLDSTQQVLLKCDVAGKKFTSLVDLTSKAAGSTADAGKVNSDSTLATQQVYYQADPNCSPDSPSAVCASKFASGEVKPLALYKTFKGEFDVSTSAGSSDAASAYQTMSKAFRAAMANGAPSSSDINAALAGGDILNTWKSFDSSLSGIDMSAAIGHIQNYMPAVSKTFADSTTFTKYQQGGNTAWTAAAQYFGKQTGSELLNGFNQPAANQGYLQQNVTAFNSGDKTAFDTMKKAGAARVMGQLAGKFSGTFSSSQFDALKKMMDSQASSFDTLDSSKFASMGEGLFNQIKAASSSTQLDLLKKNSSVFMGKIFDNPGAYTGSAGINTFTNNFVTFVQNPTGFSDATAKGCSANTDCSGGLVCGPFKYCVASCSSNCTIGAPCTSNGQCAGGFCSTDGACFLSSATIASGGGLGAVLKPSGAPCSANGECASQICSSSVCASPTVSGSVSYAGFYKKTSGQSPTCNVAFQIDGISGQTVTISIQPNDPNNPAANTFYAAGIPLTGSSSPFSITNGAIGGPGSSAGTINCRSGGGTALTLSGSRLTGTCVLTTLSGTAYPSSCTVDHTKL